MIPTTIKGKCHSWHKIDDATWNLHLGETAEGDPIARVIHKHEDRGWWNLQIKVDGEWKADGHPEPGESEARAGIEWLLENCYQ